MSVTATLFRFDGLLMIDDLARCMSNVLDTRTAPARLNVLL